MCGILGLLSLKPLTLHAAQLATALTALRHRGPDDEGYLLFDSLRGSTLALSGSETAPGVELPALAGIDLAGFNGAFGHRRLSIIDLSAAGHQPMGTTDGRCWITYNGEIYNYLELRHELESLGARFRTESDTEVLVQAYRHWGVAMLRRLVGMFAFAILDLECRTLLLARDHFGIKPLYLVQRPDGLAFASELKALLALPGVSRRGNPFRAYQFLRYGERDAEPETMFADVRCLPAAHYLKLDLESMRTDGPRRFWELNTRFNRDITASEAAVEVRRLFEESVRLHLRSDVPVGSCLSGGLDSTAIVMQAKRELGTGQSVHCFSFIGDDPLMCEEPYVDLVQGTIPHKVRPRADDIIRDVRELVLAQELPFESLSIYAQFRVFKLAHAAGMKVMLDGQGSDEIFGGYYTFIGAKITSLLAQLRFSAARQVLAAAPQNVRELRGRMLATAAGRLVPTGLQPLLAHALGEPEFPPWLRRDWFAARGVKPRLRRHGRGRDALKQELKLSIEHLTLPALLRYEDANSMHFSIESRVPFCTPALAEFALSLPESYLVSDTGETKSVFRAAVADLVPQEILAREKVGFSVPERAWLQQLGGWLAEAPLGELPFLDRGAAEREMAAALRSKDRWPPHVWRMVNMALWAKFFAVEWS
jgi:asparagine synthase (glutamine-hydrolysing)